MPDYTDLDMTVGELLDEVDAGLAAGAEEAQLAMWSETVDAVNNSRVPGEFGCTEPRSVTGRQLGGRGKPDGKSTVSKIRN